jgi:predicted CoA-binding protein
VLPRLKAIPDTPEAVFILANPKVTDQIVQECVDLGIKHVWMHCMMGTKPGTGGRHDQRVAGSRAAVPR